jgi:hypothetical protein
MRHLNISILIILQSIFVAIVLFASSEARAQASPPFGTWATPDGDTTFYVSPQVCYFESRSRGFRIQGTCSWTSSSKGGILTIYNAFQNGAAFPEPVVYVNATTITVYGDIFTRQY